MKKTSEQSNTPEGVPLRQHFTLRGWLLALPRVLKGREITRSLLSSKPAFAV